MASGRSGLFNAKVSRGSGISRRHIRTGCVIVTVVGMICLYRFFLVPKIAPHHIASAEMPAFSEHLALDSHAQAPGIKRSAGHTQPGKKEHLSNSQDFGSHRASSTGPKIITPKSSASVKPRHQQPTAQTMPKKLPEIKMAPARPANPAVSFPPPDDHLPVHEAERDENPASPTSKHRHHSKERVLDSDMEKASAVVDTLVFPKTDRWRKRAPRVVVSKDASAHKNLKSKNYLEILPGHDIPEGHHDTCAVVGNGGVMLTKEWGHGIDQHDAVFRFNDGPTAGFEKHVGSKTTYKLINNKWSKFYGKKHPKGASEQNIVLFGNGAVGQAVHLAHTWPNENVLLMAPEFAGQSRGQYKHGQSALSAMGVVQVHGRNSAPTGIEGIFMALAICKKVHLYGFGIDTDPKIPYHYHDKVKGVEAAHSFGFQALLLKLLNYKGIFGLCVPGHDTDDCMNPRSSDLTAYEAAVEKMAAAAAANPDKARIEASMEDSGNEDGGEE